MSATIIWAATGPPEKERPDDRNRRAKLRPGKVARLRLDHTPIALRAASLQPINAAAGHSVPGACAPLILAVSHVRLLPRPTRAIQGIHPYV